MQLSIKFIKTVPDKDSTSGRLSKFKFDTKTVEFEGCAFEFESEEDNDFLRIKYTMPLNNHLIFNDKNVAREDLLTHIRDQAIVQKINLNITHASQYERDILAARLTSGIHTYSFNEDEIECSDSDLLYRFEINSKNAFFTPFQLAFRTNMKNDLEPSAKSYVVQSLMQEIGVQILIGSPTTFSDYYKEDLRGDLSMQIGGINNHPYSFKPEINSKPRDVASLPMYSSRL